MKYIDVSINNNVHKATSITLSLINEETMNIKLKYNILAKLQHVYLSKA